MRSRQSFLLYVGVLLCLLIGVGYRRYSRPFSCQQTFRIQSGEGIYHLLQDFSPLTQYKIKRYIKQQKNTPQVAQGLYQCSGMYSSQEFVDFVVQGPSQTYIPYTVLEGRSMYDIDYDLSQRGHIQSGEYIAYIKQQTSHKNISSLVKKFPRLEYFSLAKIEQYGLEGFLYPETYYLDTNKDILAQLLHHHLTTFEQKIRHPYQDHMLNFDEILSQQGYTNLTLSPWAIINLSAVIEKEEKQDANKPAIASVFFNRLSDGMQLGADITLCYGLQLRHTQCTPNKIVRHLSDTANGYNTRKVGGLPPSPIANPVLSTVKSVLFFEKTEYFYYLHDAKGHIHFSKTLQEHNNKKSKYIK